MIQIRKSIEHLTKSIRHLTCGKNMVASVFMLEFEKDSVVESSLLTLVQPSCMSWLLQRHGRWSDFGPGGLGLILSRGIGD